MRPKVRCRRNAPLRIARGWTTSKPIQEKSIRACKWTGTVMGDSKCRMSEKYGTQEPTINISGNLSRKRRCSDSTFPLECRPRLHLRDEQRKTAHPHRSSRRRGEQRAVLSSGNHFVSVKVAPGVHSRPVLITGARIRSVAAPTASCMSCVKAPVETSATVCAEASPEPSAVRRCQAGPPWVPRRHRHACLHRQGDRDSWNCP